MIPNPKLVLTLNKILQKNINELQRLIEEREHERFIGNKSVDFAYLWLKSLIMSRGRKSGGGREKGGSKRRRRG
jgi:hypothetical protein